ncbi:MAG TPA: TRAP transporter small permease [Candidatus Sulfotelmatobacter sp.]|nr:TRAP transporter small permease [Candidatus Sulfotelmatobacter sp.]
MTASSTPARPSWLDRALNGVAAGLLAVTLALSFLQVVARYVLEVSTPWSEEIARLAFVWAVFLGAAIGIRRDLHTRVDFLFVRLPDRLAAVVLAGMDLLLAGMACVMVGYGMLLVVSTRLDFSTSLGYPRNWFYLPVPVSGALMLLFLAPKLAGRLLAASRARGAP